MRMRPLLATVKDALSVGANVSKYVTKTQNLWLILLEPTALSGIIANKLTPRSCSCRGRGQHLCERRDMKDCTQSPQKIKRDNPKPTKVETGIWLLPDGRYRVRTTARDPATGKIAQREATVGSLEDARVAVSELKSKVWCQDEQAYPSPSEAAKLDDGERIGKAYGIRHYWVTSHGRVFSTKQLFQANARELKQTPSPSGYPMVTLFSDGKRMQRTVHSLVLECFVGPRPEGMDACHYDGTRDNNRLDNLRWDTREGNLQDMVRHGTVLRGERSPGSILTNDDVREIRKLSAIGAGYSELADMFGVSSTTIGSVVRRKTWKHI